jgi:hypothetical protein
MAKLEEFLKMRFPFHRPSCLEMLSLTRRRSTYFVSHADERGQRLATGGFSDRVPHCESCWGYFNNNCDLEHWGSGLSSEPSYLPELSAASFLNAHHRRLPPSLHIAAAAPWTCSCPHHRTNRPPSPVAAAAPVLDSLPCSVLLRSSQTRPHQESLELGMSNSKNSWIWTCPKYCLYQFLCVLEIIL